VKEDDKDESIWLKELVCVCNGGWFEENVCKEVGIIDFFCMNRWLED